MEQDDPLASARSALVAAELEGVPAGRFTQAYLAALRVAAVVVGERARPGAVVDHKQDTWWLLGRLAPELAEWAAYFAEAAAKTLASSAGGYSVNSREADDLLRDAQAFLGVVGRRSARLRQRSAG